MNDNNIETFIDNHLSAINTTKYHNARLEFESIKSTLMSKCKLPISRVYMGGSLGKGTALQYHFDIDIVVYFRVSNFHEFITEREKVLNHICDIISSVYERQCSWNNTSFHFTGKYDFKIDILTGAHFVDGIVQQMNKCSTIVNSSKRRSKYVAFQLGSTCSEYSDEFVRKQSRFVKRLVILCKHWCRKRLGRKITAKSRSSLIELIAIHVGREAERNCFYTSSSSLTDAFKTFLQLCSDFQNLAIEFDEPAMKSLYTKMNWTPPYVIEPSNPYNNRAKVFNDDEIAILCREAELTMNILEKCLRDGRSNVVVQFLQTMTTPQLMNPTATVNAASVNTSSMQASVRPICRPSVETQAVPIRQHYEHPNYQKVPMNDRFSRNALLCMAKGPVPMNIRSVNTSSMNVSVKKSSWPKRPLDYSNDDDEWHVGIIACIAGLTVSYLVWRMFR